MTWTTPAHVSGGLASSGQFNSEVVDNLLHLYAELLGGWTPYTPTTPNITLGAGGTSKGRYVRAGGRVHFNAHVVLGTSPVVAVGAAIGLPVVVGASAVDVTIFLARYRDVAGASAGFYVGEAAAAPGGNTAGLVAHAVAQVNATAPFTWADGDQISVSGTYEIDP